MMVQPTWRSVEDWACREITIKLQTHFVRIGEIIPYPVWAGFFKAHVQCTLIYWFLLPGKKSKPLQSLIDLESINDSLFGGNFPRANPAWKRVHSTIGNCLVRPPAINLCSKHAANTAKSVYSLVTDPKTPRWQGDICLLSGFWL